MRIGILGTGVVGQTIGTALVRRGHTVRLGSRTANNTKARDWVASNGERASQGTFSDTATFAELVFNCTSGTASLEALHSAGIGNLAGKVLVDVANPLDFSHGMPPTLSICNTDSLAEQIQREDVGICEEVQRGLRSRAFTTGRFSVRDVWRQKEMGVFERKFQAEVPYHGVVLLKVVKE